MRRALSSDRNRTADNRIDGSIVRTPRQRSSRSAGAGLSYNAISTLDRDDITTDGDSRLDRRPPPNQHRFQRLRRLQSGRDVRTLGTRSCGSPTLPFDDTASRATAAQNFSTHDRDRNWVRSRSRLMAGHLPLSVAARTAAEIGSVTAAHRTEIPPLHTHGASSSDPPEDTPSRPRSPFLGRAFIARARLRGLPLGCRRTSRAHTLLAQIPARVGDAGLIAWSDSYGAPSTSSATRRHPDEFHDVTDGQETRQGISTWDLT